MVGRCVKQVSAGRSRFQSKSKRMRRNVCLGQSVSSRKRTEKNRKGRKQTGQGESHQNGTKRKLGWQARWWCCMWWCMWWCSAGAAQERVRRR
ncbi:hypothetical protein LI328DRAFT_136389 [Trichoderma asperelloides]|nr:hypothetical protein LI328DRAFT_136389 [Trichoderma asperelloides]